VLNLSKELTVVQKKLKKKNVPKFPSLWFSSRRGKEKRAESLHFYIQVKTRG